ncbi:MAG: glycoside hydrolase family 3 protein [Lachnospiraceae bacterium]|nr:glycoside hydrolase family 3 protein [Lachnospiraceae bacterium]
MNRKLNRHREIVRKRIIATVVALLILTVVLGLVIFGAAKLFKKFMPENPDAGLAVASEEETEAVSSESTEVLEIGPVSQVEEEVSEPDPGLSSEELAEQYANAVQKEIPGGSALDVEDYLSGMTLEDKVCQLFFITPEQLTGFATVTAAGQTTAQALDEHPVGGLVYFSQNLVDPVQTEEMLENTQNYALSLNGIPLFLAVDEEGGEVTRIAENSAFAVEHIPSMRDIGATNDPSNGFKAGEIVGHYLKDLGFNLDFGPVADVAKEGGSAIGTRSFGTDPELVSRFALQYYSGLKSAGVMGCLKHYPGFGRAEENTDFKEVFLDAGMEELKAKDLIPFRNGVEEGVSFIMVGNMAFPNAVGDNTPASLSTTMIKKNLREGLSYNGIVITDALNAVAIASHYKSGEAAVQAIKAGADFLLMPEDFNAAYETLLSAVKSGDIPEARLDESMRRILKIKLALD